jgi:hypothetical protein
MEASNIITEALSAAGKKTSEVLETPVGKFIFAAVAMPVLNKFNPEEEAKYKVSMHLDNNDGTTAAFRKAHLKASGRSLVVDDELEVTKFNAKSLQEPVLTVQGESVEKLAAEQGIEAIELVKKIFNNPKYLVSGKVTYEVIEGKKGTAIVLKAIDVESLTVKEEA